MKQVIQYVDPFDFSAIRTALGAATHLSRLVPQHKMRAMVYTSATATAQELFNACSAHGGAKWDHSGMVRALEKMANFEIGQ